MKVKTQRDPLTHRFIAVKEPVPCIVTLRFTVVERAIIQACADNDQVTIREFIRTAVMDKIRNVPMLGGK